MPGTLTRNTLGRQAAYSDAPVAGVENPFATADWTANTGITLSIVSGALRQSRTHVSGTRYIVENASAGATDSYVEVRWKSTSSNRRLGPLSRAPTPPAANIATGIGARAPNSGNTAGSNEFGDLFELSASVLLQSITTSPTAVDSGPPRSIALWTRSTAASARASATTFSLTAASPLALTSGYCGICASNDTASSGTDDVDRYYRTRSPILTVNGPTDDLWEARIRDGGGVLIASATPSGGVATFNFDTLGIWYSDLSLVTLEIFGDAQAEVTATVDPTELLWGGDVWTYVPPSIAVGFDISTTFTPALLPDAPLGVAYRLRVRDQSTQANPNGTTNVLVATSLGNSGTHPFIAGPPEGDGQEIDLLSGDLRTGAYRIRVIDAEVPSDGEGWGFDWGMDWGGGVDGTQRLVTRLLEDSQFQQQLLSRRAYIEITRDGGTTWQELIGGYVTGIILANAVAYDFYIGDTRRVETTHRIFTWSGTPGPSGVSERDVFPQRSCLAGGPVIGGFLSRPDTGGDTWEFVTQSASGLVTTQNILSFTPREGYLAPDYRLTRKPQALQAAYVRALQPYAVQGFAESIAGVPFNPFSNEASTYYPNVSVIIEIGGNSYNGELRHLVTYGQLYIYVAFAAGAEPTLVAGDLVRARFVANEVTPETPLYVDDHPVDLVTKLYDTVGIQYDQATADTVKALLGENLRYALRITEPVMMLDFLSSAVFGPFGFTVRNNPAGLYEFIPTRQLPSASPSTTVTADSMRSDAPPIFTLEEQTIVSSFRITYRVLSLATVTRDSAMEIPPDGIVEATVPVILENSDQSVFSTREVRYDFAGMVHLVGSWQSHIADLIEAIVRLGFDRYGRGAPVGELELLDGEPGSDAYVGDEINLDVSSYPNQNYRIGESNVGPRIVQIVRRTETASGPNLKFVDSGVGVQPVSPAATVSIAATTGAPRTVAAFTITNAAAINAAAVLGVAVEWAQSVSEPTGNGALFTRYVAGQVPTGANVLPAASPGSTVWVRVRTEQVERRPSAWSDWESVALAAFDAPDSIALSDETAESVTVEWVPAEDEYWTDLFCAPGNTPPADWEPFRVNRFRPSSNRTIIRGLAPATDYIIGVAHRDLVTGEKTAVVSDTTTTAANVVTLDAPLAMAVLSLAEDAGQPQGIALALWAFSEEWDIKIERADDGGGFPGPYTEIARVAGTTLIYRDPLPADGLTRWYRIQHVLPGFQRSAYTGGQEGVPAAMPDGLTRPTLAPVLRTWLSNETPTSADVNWSGSGTIEVDIDGGGFGVPAPSPITVAKTGTIQRYQFRATLNDITVLQLIEVEADPSSVPSFSADPTNTEDVAIACGVAWELDIAYTTVNANDLDYMVRILNFDTLAVVATGLTTASGNYVDNTAETGDPLASGFPHTRRYTVQIVRLIDGVVVESRNTNRLDVETGPAC